MPTRERFWTIPNVLSLYRIVIFPFILYLILSGNESLFAIFITINFITDILDGLIARTFNMKTNIGIKLDSWADTGTYLLAFLAIYLFKWSAFQSHVIILYVFVAIWIISYVVVFIKFRGLLGLHTYLFKITGYLQGAFIVLLFIADFYTWFYYLAIGIGILALLEEIVIILSIKAPMSNVKGYYWLRKNKSL
jgi:cardiolipin synthase (CMP-forming)